MSIEVTFIDDPLDYTKWKVVETNDLLKCLVAELGKWPENARLYKDVVSDATEVTPYDEPAIDRLRDAQGKYYVVNYPGFGVDTLLYVALAAAVVAAFVFKPKIPNQSQRAQNSKSPNNELSQRTNSARPNARIPDIYGVVRSTPDLITLPYTMYVNNQEVEDSVMCIGRGDYEIFDCKDGTTPAGQIDGTSINIWRSDKDVMTDAPYFTIGSAITDRIPLIYKNDAVNGQTLKPFVQKVVEGDNDISFIAPNEVRISPSSIKTFAGLFDAGDTAFITYAVSYDPALLHNEVGQPKTVDSLRFKVASASIPAYLTVGAQFTITQTTMKMVVYNDSGVWQEWDLDLNGRYEIAALSLEVVDLQNWVIVQFVDPAAVNGNWSRISFMSYGVDAPLKFDVDGDSKLVDLTGIYEVDSIDGKSMFLVDPDLVNSDWTSIPGGDTGPISPTVSNNGSYEWEGPFIIDNPLTTTILANVVAPNGLYGDNGQLIYPLFVVCYLGVTPINAAGVPTGPEVQHQITVGAPIFENTDGRGTTLRLEALPASRYSVRLGRETPELDIPDNAFVQEVKWRDLYYGYEIANTNFGDVTVIRSRVTATAGALSVKERRLNLLVGRMIPRRIAGDVFTTDKFTTKRADEIIAAICKDPRIGNRPNSEIDFESIYNTVAEGEAYFGVEDAVQFCYTFDEDSLTFEDTISAIAQTIFCVAYRQGSIIKLKLERATEDSTLLFNHRNKIPGSETRTVTFGPASNYDGITYNYVSPVDDAIVTKFIPEDRTAINEKKIESIGVRNEIQAHIHAWREYQKIRFQNMVVKFTATQEAELLVITDRILVADNTRTDTTDGEIVGVEGLLLVLSQKFKSNAAFSYTIFLQLYDRSVQALDCFPVNGDPYAVTIPTAPLLPLVTQDNRYAKTTYTIVRNDDPRQTAFLLTDRETGENGTSTVSAINYTERYYQHDKDFAPDPASSWLNSLGNMILWLDGADPEAFVLSSGAVSQWRDKSDDLNHAVQPIANLRPAVDLVTLPPRSAGFVDENSF